MIETVINVLPVFLIIGLGFSLKGTGLVNRDFLAQLNRLVYFVALPAMLFYKLAIADFSASFSSVLLFGMLISLSLVFCLSYLFGMVRRYPAATHGAFCQGSFRGNLAFIGLPIIYNSYGESGFAMAGILLGFLIPFVNFLAVLGLLLPQRQSDHKLGSSFWAYQIVFNPLLVASFIGIGWSYFNLGMPQVLDRSLDILTGITLPLALISIGASFSPKKLQGEMATAALATTIKLVGAPLLTATVLVTFGITGRDLAVGVLLAGTPTATAAYIMAQQLKSDAELSGSIIMLSTMLSIFSYSVSLYILKISGI